MAKYQDVYPSSPILNSADLNRPSAAALLQLEYFEAEPDRMPYQTFQQHHILVNLRDQPHRVENWRDGQHRDFIYHKDEIIVTPAGVRSGWRWHKTSKVIVITLDPQQFETFAQKELGMLLTQEQLKDVPQFIDHDITQAAIQLMEALQSKIGSAVMFESFARVFLVKLIQKYGLTRQEELAYSKSFTAEHYKRVLDYIAGHFGRPIPLEDLAREAGLSPYHFARLFKQTIGQTPHQFVMAYRVEKAKAQLADPTRALIDIAYSCGFSDQAHFSRVFKKLVGKTPKQFRSQA